MDAQAREKYLKLALRLFGVIFIVGIYAMMTIWPEGWGWEPRQAEYEQMIVGVYAVMGVFMLWRPGIQASTGVSSGSSCGLQPRTLQSCWCRRFAIPRRAPI